MNMSSIYRLITSKNYGTKAKMSKKHQKCIYKETKHLNIAQQ